MSVLHCEQIPEKGADCPNPNCKKWNKFPTNGIRRNVEGRMLPTALCTYECGTLIAYPRDSFGRIYSQMVGEAGAYKQTSKRQTRTGSPAPSYALSYQ